ncbi:hypothetical protein [Sphingopyxis macrogoltabida]|uniref:Uncharacterized protein n=1 Tax=Sphingopyxis macrogoltabida TaxID=33050 RepID=A0AAC9AVC2_SPHMC|nr:hypothetical protein [Sphingopyxis macrogoltabida]ALJ12635.1 hypothetical protein LH19_07125 [Sphingopyxis macrogoltabida]AMU89896.1 hypothetical protein ATM17_12705 [Sphingopyxis macrogoltabida]
MGEFYADMRAMATELLAPTSEGGLGQGSIALVRETPGAPGANPWDPPAPSTYVRTPLNGAARGVAKELIGAPVETGGQIVATDKQVIVAPWGAAYDPGDVLELDGAPVTVLKIDNIPAVGVVCAIRFIVR